MHPEDALRSRTQFVQPDGSLQAVKAALKIPVLANGNVRSRSDADECISTTGRDHVMSNRSRWVPIDLEGSLDTCM